MIATKANGCYYWVICNSTMLQALKEKGKYDTEV